MMVDDLHASRGLYGADVTIHIHRVRNSVFMPDLQCIGISAIMGSCGGIREQREDVAHVATKLFSDDVKAEHVVLETLRCITAPWNSVTRACLRG